MKLGTSGLLKLYSTNRNSKLFVCLKGIFLNCTENKRVGQHSDGATALARWNIEAHCRARLTKSSMGFQRTHQLAHQLVLSRQSWTSCLPICCTNSKCSHPELFTDILNIIVSVLHTMSWQTSSQPNIIVSVLHTMSRNIKYNILWSGNENWWMWRKYSFLIIIDGYSILWIINWLPYI